MSTNYIEDHSNGTLDQVKLFAKNHPQKASLDHSFESLERICASYQKNLEEAGGDMEHPTVKAHIYHDFAPCSMMFHVTNNPDARGGMVGGIIFHGSHDGFGSGSAPTFSVSLDKADGWQIHT